MDRSAANTLRIVGIVATVVLVVAGCGALLFIAWFVVLRGGLTRNAMITHPKAVNTFLGALFAVAAMVTLAIVTIRRLATGIVRGPLGSRRLATAEGPAAVTSLNIPKPSRAGVRAYSSSPYPSTLHSATAGRKTIGWLALALGVKIAVGVVRLFSLASRPFAPRHWTLMLLGPFILNEAPYAILIWILLTRPRRLDFAFLVGLLAISLLEVFFNSMIAIFYHQSYGSQAMGLGGSMLSGLICVVALVLAYKAIRQMGIQPKVSSVIFAAVGTFFYFFLVSEITPYLYRLLR